MKRNFWLIVAAVTAVALLLLNVFLTFQNTRQLNEDARWVAHTHKVISELEGLRSLTADAETGVRGFIITGENRYLEPYDDATNAIKGKVDEAEIAMADDPIQRARFPRLREHIEKRWRTLGEVLTTRKNSGFDAARQEVLTDRGRMEMDALRLLVGEMIRHEEDLLVQRAASSERTYRAALLTGMLSGLLALIAILARFLLVNRHMKASKNAAAVIAEQAERLRTTLASIGDGVITTDKDGLTTNLNSVAESLTGWKNEDAVGQKLDKVFHTVNEKTRDPLTNPAMRALREGVIVGLANHTVLISKDGTERPIDDSAAPIRRKEGEIVGCVLVFRDVSERRLQSDALEDRVRIRTAELAAANEDLQRSNFELEQFASVASHDLQEPLRKIQAFGDRLNSKFGDQLTGQGTEYLERILASADRMRRLIDDLLSFSRVTTKAQPYVLTDLALVVQEAISDLEGRIEQTGGRVEADHLPTIDADPSQMRQVFQNLVANGLKFHRPDEPPVVKIRSRMTSGLGADGQEVEFCEIIVEDNGIGFEETYLDRIFELFQRLHGRDEYEGTGMGLAICRKIVERHGGAITAKSKPGEGSAFIVMLPVRQITEG